MGILTLEELVPQTGQFTLAKTGKTYRLRPFSIADESWLQANFGGDKQIQKIFDEFQLINIAKIAFHQMFEEDKIDFKKQKVKIMNEDGDEEEIELGGYRLLYGMISGLKEKKEVLIALLQTLGISRPKVEEMTKEHEDQVKKKLNEIGIGQPTGQP